MKTPQLTRSHRFALTIVSLLFVACLAWMAASLLFGVRDGILGLVFGMTLALIAIPLKFGPEAMVATQNADERADDRRIVSHAA